MVAITVILPTVRVGGLDVTFAGLERQTFENFELILVDKYYTERETVVKEYAESKGVSLVHVPPRRNVDYFAHCMYANTGLALASGELICFLSDYLYVQPFWLERHWNLYKGGYAGISPMVEYELPPVKEDLSNAWLTIFRSPFNPEVVQYLKAINIDSRSDGAMSWYGKGDSMPMRTSIILNGFDEWYDGGHGANDIDFAKRAEAIGQKFKRDEANVTWHFNIGGALKRTPVLPAPRSFRTESEIWHYFHKKMARLK